MADNPDPTHGVNADEYCSFCWVEALGQRPCVYLTCGHIFHDDCLTKRMKQRWTGPRINFGFLQCPTCKSEIEGASADHIRKMIEDSRALEKDILDKAVKRAKFEGIDKDERLKNPSDIYYNKLQEYAMARLSYYLCFKCKSPYFGGLKSCENVNEGAKEFKPEELVCANCSAVSIGGGIVDCKLHGKDFIEFKCKFCCNIAQWFCWGTTHFCESCHSRQNRGDYVSKKKPHELP